ncbi:MAG: ATP-binding cassette domain-containing protein [Bacteroidaceae bacterium]
MSLNDREQWIIYGANGSGKTSLAKIISSTQRPTSGNIYYNFQNTKTKTSSPSQNIARITFVDRHAATTTNMPYQMRWNTASADPVYFPLIADVLPELSTLPQEFIDKLFSANDLEKLKRKTIISLSSGEYRRFQLLRILSKHPSVLIADNPFIGLDYEGCQQVSSLISMAMETLHTTIIMITSRLNIVPSGFTHVVTVDKGQVTKTTINKFTLPQTTSGNSLKSIKTPKSDTQKPIIAEGHDITIKYDSQILLQNFNFTIRRGQHWALIGPNGSGKSTLLSLICADNPQSYACNISLFGKKRGSGESIWEIKRRIGFVSPEMHRHTETGQSAANIIARGIYDSRGKYTKPTEEAFKRALLLLDRFKILSKSEISFGRLSTGEQRIVLLCRAFIKEPELLILDEPFHALDDNNINIAKQMISEYCANPKNTLIMVSHNPEEFPPETDHIITLSKL